MNEKQISMPDDFLERVAKVYGQNHGIIAAYRSGHARPAIVFYERACEPISALQVAQAYGWKLLELLVYLAAKRNLERQKLHDEWKSIIGL